ncbi:hypothetical protein [Lacimicrobium alkaliphilum]|uniref:MotA/TolQ/ExbB proton channel domain-containing protein n=1 Tax=Lacimicrobium alkaliphilum TaxID=1526571 RepID=A0ABQ1RRW5_9ALTE|nr:hypothetical protein [Lacimicrobium alkaliphilum]GGD79512.1 hypothetical protein GCM10011357_38110 [Lacimicrobium alkaliphilum]
MEEKNTGTLSAKEHKIDANTLRQAFVIHTLVGLLLCLAITGFKLPIWAVVILGTVVMGSYYFQYHKGGQPTALLAMFSDSVYYLGFILTLISLVCSMLFFDIEEGASSASVVISQFGAAMITTLLGMGIRIYLQNFDTTVETAQLSARESLDETVKGFNVQMRRTNETLSKLSNAMNKNIEDTEDRNNKSIEMFKVTQERLVSLGESSLAEFAKSSEKVLSNSINRLGEVSQQIPDKLSLVSNELIESSKGQHTELNENIIKSLKVHFDKLNDEMVATFETTKNASKEFGSIIGETGSGLRSLGTSAESVSEKLSAMEHFAPDVNALAENQEAYIINLKVLSDEIASRTKSLLDSEINIEQHMKTVAENYKNIIDNYQDFISSSSAGKLVEEEEKLLAAMKVRVSSIEQLSAQWEVEIQAMSSHSKDFSENLVKTAKFITKEMSSPSTSKEVVNG